MQRLHFCAARTVSRITGTRVSDKFNNFVIKKFEVSELFKFYNNLLILISMLMNLIFANRTRNWEMYLNTLDKWLPVFHTFDKLNYIKCTLCSKDMRLLKEKALLV